MLRRSMTNRVRVDGGVSQQVVTVSFGEMFQTSLQFDNVFKEGMALVERTAAYLDGEGRRDAKGLSGTTTVLYASESMRLTTRLLDLASWLLIRRELRDGAISPEQARAKRQRVKLKSFGRPSHTKGFNELPKGLRALIQESFALHDRIVQLDKAMFEPAEPVGPAVNPVAEQMARLQAAFGPR